MSLFIDITPFGSRAGPGGGACEWPLWMIDPRRRLPVPSAPSPALPLGSGPINCTIEASKWRRYWGRVGAAGSIATRKAARTQDRSHFGVPSGFDRFCPLLRRQVWKYRHIPTPCLLALDKIASNLDRAINGS